MVSLWRKLSTDGLEPFAPSSNYLNNRGAANKKAIFGAQAWIEQF
jgi:hypothetical protein